MPLALFNQAERQRLNSFPEHISGNDLHSHYHLSHNDLNLLTQQRGEHNRFGCAIQLCALRHLGFIPKDLLTPPPEALHLLAEQLALVPERLGGYNNQNTQNTHLLQIMTHTGYRRASPIDSLELSSWLADRAVEHDRPLLLFEMACEFLKRRHIIRLGVTALERHISEARERAHKLSYNSLKPLLTPEVKTLLDEILVIPDGATVSRLAWLQQSPTDVNPTQIIEVLKKIDYLQQAGVGAWDVSTLNPNRFKWLAKIGARRARQSLLRTDQVKRTCILIAFLHQSLISYTDDVIEMVDQRIWKLYKDAKKEFEQDRKKARQSINHKLALLQVLGETLLNTSISDSQIRTHTFTQISRERLIEDLEENRALLRPEKDDHVDYFRKHYQAIRNVAKPFLATLSFKAWDEDQGLFAALDYVKDIHLGKRHQLSKNAPTAFVPDTWLNYLWCEGRLDRHYYEMAAIWVLRECLRSGKVYVDLSRHYAPVESYLIPKKTWPEHRKTVHELTGTPLEARVRLKQRMQELEQYCVEVEAILQDTNKGYCAHSSVNVR